MGACCSSPSLGFHTFVPWEATVQTHGLHFWFRPLCLAGAPVQDKEGLKIKHCKYSCFLDVEPPSEFPWPPGQPGLDNSFEGGEGWRAEVPSCAAIPGCSVS